MRQKKAASAGSGLDDK